MKIHCGQSEFSVDVIYINIHCTSKCIFFTWRLSPDRLAILAWTCTHMTTPPSDGDMSGHHFLGWHFPAVCLILLQLVCPPPAGSTVCTFPCMPPSTAYLSAFLCRAVSNRMSRTKQPNPWSGMAPGNLPVSKLLRLIEL